MKRIELSRKHGPFDPRWPAVRRVKDATRLDAEQLATSLPGALRRWESEGGATRPERRREVSTPT
jgi:hypothetical protein